MKEKLQSLNKLCDSKQLKTYVQNLRIEKLCSELSNVCLKEDGFVTLQILFKGFSNSALCQQKRAKIAEEILSNIEKKIISPRLSSKLITVLATEANNFSTSHLMTFTNSCLHKMIRNQEDDGEHPWWKDLLPQLLSAIAEKSAVEQNGTIISGSEFKSEVVTTILMSNWKDSMISNIASMFVDMPLSSEEHLKVVKKLCKSFKNLKINEVPPLTHQLLQLTKEQNSIPLFLALADFFDVNLYNYIEWDGRNSVSHMIVDGQIPFKEVQVVEGTVLYHIYNAASILSPKSVKDFVKLLRDCLYYTQFTLRPFFFTFLLNVSRISYAFEEEILSLLTSAILRSVAQDDKVFNSTWLESVVSAKVDVESILNKVIQNCCRDSNNILKGLVTLGFELLGYKPRGKEIAQSEHAWGMGIGLLVNLVQKYPHVTRTVFQNLINQISQDHDSAQYTDCLTKIASKEPLVLLEYSALIMQLLGNICARLSSVVGQRVLAAILPLTKMSPVLRDNLIIFLRKALFSDKSSREMAVYGFLELLKDLRITDMKSLSQSVSQNFVGITQIYSGTYDSTGCAISNEGMCLEVLAILRQVFEYHYQVKIVLYKGVYDSFYVNPKLGVHILNILKTRFDNFYNGPKAIPPLDFHKTVVCQGSSVIIKEPIGYLLFGMALIVAKTEDDCRGKSQFRDILNSTCEAMAESDIPHFDLDKENGDIVLGDSPESQLKQEKIRQILSVYEALMGYTLCTWQKDSMESSRKLNALFKGYSRLSDYARSAGKTTRKKHEGKKINEKDRTQDCNQGKEKLKVPSSSIPPTVLNWKCVSRLLAILNGLPVSWATPVNTEALKSKKELHHYAFNVLLELISEARGFSHGELARSRYVPQYISYVGRILYVQCLLRLSEVKEFDVQCAVLAMECFSELLNLIYFHFKSKISKFFTEMGLTSKDVKVQLKMILESTLEQINNLSETEEEEKKEAQTRKLFLILISISALLIDHLPREGSLIQGVLQKIRLICKEKKIQNANVAKGLLSLLLSVHAKNKPFDVVVLDLVLCLCDSMTLIDDEMEIDTHENFNIVNPKTANGCLTAISEAVHSLINEVEWALARCKAELVVLSYPTEEPLETRHEALVEKEREICRCLNFNIKVLSMICTIAVPPGALADGVLKEVGNLYSKLVLATKYFLYKFVKHQKTFLTAKFEKTVKAADQELTKNMYCFTEHIIADGSASEQDPPLKKHKKDAIALKNKVLKETKIIPKVIFEKEQFQKHILQLSNKTKVDLEIRNSMARDYRLYAKQVKEIIEKENNYLEEILMDVDESSQSETSQSAKKMKTQE